MSHMTPPPTPIKQGGIQIACVSYTEYHIRQTFFSAE